MVKLIAFVLFLLLPSHYLHGHPSEEHSIQTRNIVSSQRVLISIPFAVHSTDKKSGPYIPVRELSQPGEGYPTAFRFDKTGNLHLLVPAVNVIHQFSPQGKFIKTVKLTNPQGGPLPAEAFLFDFVIDDGGNYLVLDQSGGWITKFEQSGKAVTTFGHFVYGSSMALSPEGNILVTDSALSLVNIFTKDGVFEKDVKGANLYPETNSDENLVRSTNLSFRKSILWLKPLDGRGPGLLKVISSVHDGAKLYEAKPLGFDSNNRVVVITTEKTPDKKYYSYLHFIGTNTYDVFEVTPNMELVVDVPRSWLLTSKDEVATFRTKDNRYEILLYKNPSANK